METTIQGLLWWRAGESRVLDFFQHLINILISEQSGKVILRDANQALTGKEIFDKASDLAYYFQQKGAKPGDKIAIQLPNSLEFILCYFACLFGQFTIVPINSALPKKDIEYILSITNAVFHIQTIKELTFETRPLNSPIHFNDDFILAIFFTSGTTSKPKGVCHTAKNMLANAYYFNELVGLDQHTCMLHVMPMGYMAGFLNTVLCPIIAGGCVVVGPQFNAADAIHFWKPVVDNHVNAMWLTPTMTALLARLNRSSTIADWTREHLKHVFVGTAPLPKATKASFEKVFGVECLESYGMSEVMLVSANSHVLPQKEMSVGRLMANIEVQARDNNQNVLAANQVGNLYIKTPFALKGYLDPQSGDICSPLEADWLATGDCGLVDEENNLYITGRIKDLIIHGGTNVSPRAVEEILLLHPDILDAAVLGKTHPFWGEEVIAFLILQNNKQFNQKEIADYCQKNLQNDAVPSAFKIMTEFPRASTGKIQVHKLREHL